MEVRGQGEEFDEDGEPRQFNYLNIYSRGFIDRVVAKIGNMHWEVVEDDDFNPASFQARGGDNLNATNLTAVADGKQVNEYIILPWCFLEIRK